MKIAFDAQPLLDNQKTGIGYYSACIISKLQHTHPENQYFLSYFALRHASEKAASLETYRAAGAHLLPCHIFSEALYKLIWAFFPLPYRFFFGSKAELTHFFNFHVPPGVKGKKIATVHDMGYLAVPETVRAKTKTMLLLSLRASCRRADRILTISEFSKTEIIKYLKIPPEKIEIVCPAIDHNRFCPNLPTEQYVQVRQKYRLPEHYLLYLGTLEPRKNLVRVVEGYGLLVKKMPNAPPLVLAGRKGWLYDDIFARVSALGLSDKIIFPGYVTDEDTPLLMGGATAFIFPSLYEGFGMPPLEAMACGTPVLTANAASLPEVVGDAAVLVDPYSIEEICDGMLRLATDSALRQSLREKGLARAKLFTWENAADKLYAVYEELMKE